MPKNLSHHDFHYRSRQRLFTAFLASATSLLGLGLIFALTTGFFQSAGQTYQLKFTVLAQPTPGQTTIINKAVVTTSTIDPPDPEVSLKIEWLY